MFSKISGSKGNFTFIDASLNLKMNNEVSKDKVRFTELWVTRQRLLYIFVGGYNMYL